MKLTAAARKKIPASKFAGPGRSFPVNDPVHQRMAISGATMLQKAGNISPSMAAKIRTRARKMLGVKPDKDSAAGAAT